MNIEWGFWTLKNLRLSEQWRKVSLVCARSLFIGATVACIGGWGEASAQEQCLVADPTGTPLNVRAAPNGPIVETLSNGIVVTILDRSSANGRAWVYVRRNKDQAPLGWVFRDYLNCDAQEYRPSTPKGAGSNEAAQDAPSNELSGTGFFVAQQYVLTNHHVIKDCGSNPIWVSHPDRRPERAFISGLDETNDLALLHTDLPSTAVASFRFGPRVGEPVAIYGFPLSGLLSTGGNFTMGNVTSLAGLNDDTRLLQTSAPTQPGNSGGPLLDMSGTVVGVVEGQLNALLMMKAISDVPQNVNFAIQTPIVINFLSIKGISPPLANKGRKNLDPADVADLAKAFTIQVACHSSEPAPGPVQSGSTRPAPSLLSSSLGRWAIADRSNCEVPNKAFALRLDGGTIVWQDGLGNVDIESIIHSDENEFRTTTVNSMHKSGRGYPLGTSWVYLRSGPDAIQVTESGRRTFHVVRCR